ncbi:MAG: glycosyltransferase family 2 protein [Deltaproteobacteria bacterium]|nr:glycosyltransferase family 2 protein [Deltaproteobacteria bacterium]
MAEQARGLAGRPGRTAPRAARVALVIPALNEEAAIAKVLAEVPAEAVDETIVVDNGSTDRTAEVARAAGARVVREAARGYGAACLAGIQAAGPADVLVFLDGDYSDPPAEIPAVLGPVLSGSADLTLGSRTRGPREPGALPAHARLGNQLVLLVVRLLYGVRLSDFGSFRAIRREALESLGMEQRTYGWPIEMVVKAARRGLRIREVPIPYRRRIGKSKVAGTVRGSLLAGYHLLATALRYALLR